MPRSVFIDKTVKALGTDFCVRSVESDGLAYFLDPKFIPTTRLLTTQELESLASSHVESSLVDMSMTKEVLNSS